MIKEHRTDLNDLRTAAWLLREHATYYGAKITLAKASQLLSENGKDVKHGWWPALRYEQSLFYGRLKKKEEKKCQENT